MIKSAYQKNKKGFLVGEVIFILLNIAFFSMLLYYAYNTTMGSKMKEKVLAREIALLINSAEPNTIISLNIEEYKSIAEKKSIDNFIKLENGSVSVSLAGGEKYPYFSAYDVKGQIVGDFFTISVNERR